MSPELLDPEKFGFKDSRQTKSSDCYAFGMVVYEVLSGQVPFSRHHVYAVIARVLEGERPGRPRGEEGALFTDDVWSILERCWKSSPGDRPSINDVLRCMEKGSLLWTPPSPRTLTSPPTTNLPARCSEPSTGESTDDDDVLSPSERISSWPLQGLPLKGDQNEMTLTLLLTSFQIALVMPRIARTLERVR